MSDFTARIRRVRMKDGADVHVLHTPRDYAAESDDPENVIGTAIGHAKKMASYDEEGSRIDGFLLIGFFDDGSTSLSFRIPKRIPGAMVPGYITELVRRDVVMKREAESVFDEKFRWVE